MGSASAHADTDVVAVPAGSEAVVTFRPTHGCDGSPTINVRIRLDVPDATAVAVDGWTSSMTADETGQPIVEWSGGSLPSDVDGAFPVRFVAPATPGTMLRFPSVQTCENGEKLNWTAEDPESSFPAPRVLVLPEGFAPAKTIDEVPLDAPGRNLLLGTTDADNPAAVTTTTPPVTTTSEFDPTTTSSTSIAPRAADAPALENAGADESGSTWMNGGLIVVVVAIVATLFVRKRRGSGS